MVQNPEILYAGCCERGCQLAGDTIDTEDHERLLIQPFGHLRGLDTEMPLENVQRTLRFLDRRFRLFNRRQKMPREQLFDQLPDERSGGGSEKPTDFGARCPAVGGRSQNLSDSLGGSLSSDLQLRTPALDDRSVIGLDDVHSQRLQPLLWR